MYIYKYRSFNVNNLKALRGNEIWFSRGVKFNDPFDCSMNVPLTLLSTESLREFIVTNSVNKFLFDWAKNNKEILDSVVTKQIEKSISMMNKNELDQHALNPIADFVTQALVRSFVCCFSNESTNPLLWSHYSDSHRGFCIRFKKDILLRDLCPAEHGNVKYINEPINLMHSIYKEGNPAKDIIFCKSDVWSYEKEYRLVHSSIAENETDDNRISRYSDDAIDCIILGINTSDSDLNLLKSIMSGRDIIYKKIRRGINDYNLTVDVERF